MPAPFLLTFDEIRTMTSPDLSLLGTVRTDWTLEEARAVYTAPFSDLLFHAQRVHRSNILPTTCK